MSSSLLARLGGAVVQRLASLLAWAYPRRFRRETGHEFTHIAAHRYGRELASSGSAGVAIGRTTLVLCADTIQAAPAMWRTAVIGDRQMPTMRRRMMQWFTQGADDMRIGLRMFVRQPLFSLMVVATLGLGIGASAAAFATLDRVILRPFPFPDGDRMAFVSMMNVEQGWRMVPDFPIFERWRANAVGVEQLEVYQESSATYLGDGVPEVLDSANVSPGLTRLLSLRAVRGRALGSTDLEPGAAPAIMVSESFWRQKLGGAADVLDRTIQFGAITYNIVGVWPQEARVHPRVQADVFFIRREAEVVRPSSWSYLVAKLRPGVTPSQVEQELASHIADLPDATQGRRPSVSPPASFMSDAYVQGLWLVFGASLLLMLVGVANASNLLLARAASRTRELGVRLALGGTPGRLVRMFLTEGAVLSFSGALMAIAVAWGTFRLLSYLAVGNIPPSHFAGINGVVIGFALGAALLATLVCGIVPVVQARSTDVRRLGGGEGDSRVVGSTSRVRQALVSVQAAVGVVLIAGAILMSRSLANLTTSDVGFAVHELVTLSVSAPQSRYATPEARNGLVRRVREALETIPGVTGIVTANMPLFRESTSAGLPYLDGETPPTGVEGQIVSSGAAPGYFSVMGIPLRAGRLFTPDEDRGVAIVNESFARSRGGNVLGRRLYQPRRGVPHDQLKPVEIVGVVGDIRSGGASRDVASPVQVYYPGSGESEGWARFMVRTKADPGGVLAAARQRIAVIDPLLPVLSANTGTGVFEAETAQHRFVAVLLGGLAVLGVILAVGGVYGAVTIEVRRRTREVGLRVALGASGSQVVGLIVRRAMRPVMLGAVGGVVAWLWMSSLLTALLFRIEASDATSTIAGVATLALVAGLACVIPARRASRVDPAITLRVE